MDYAGSYVDYIFPDDAYDSSWALNEFDINDLVGLGEVSNLLLDVGVFITETTATASVTGNNDITDAMVRVTYEYSVVPVPAAVWLFGSGILALAGVARRSH